MAAMQTATTSKPRPSAAATSDRTSVSIPRDPQFGRQLEAWRERVENELARRLPAATTIPTRLHEALRYSVLGAGKRIRPATLLMASRMAGNRMMERLKTEMSTFVVAQS